MQNLRTHRTTLSGRKVNSSALTEVDFKTLMKNEEIKDSNVLDVKLITTNAQWSQILLVAYSVFKSVF